MTFAGLALSGLLLLVVLGLAAILALAARANSLEKALERQSLRDALTGLPNRWSLQERMETILASAKRYQRRFAVLCIDLDGFKAINERSGHRAGDRVLCEVAERLRAVVRTEEMLARLASDEFAVVLSEIRGRDDATTVADRILGATAEPVEIDGGLARVAASIGIALYPGNGEDRETLVAAAEAAMNEAKRTGGSRAAFAAG